MAYGMGLSSQKEMNKIDPQSVGLPQSWNCLLLSKDLKNFEYQRTHRYFFEKGASHLHSLVEPLFIESKINTRVEE